MSDVPKIKIAVADDQIMFRSGLVSMLNEIGTADVIIEAGDGKILLKLLEESSEKIDVVFLDYRMPNMNGIQVAKIIRKKYPDTKILMLSMYDDEEFVISALENGANGYLTKDDEPAEISKAVESVISTGYYLNDRTSKFLINNMIQKGTVNPDFKSAKPNLDFSDSEIIVMRLIAKEKSTKEIASLMLKSERTIDSYRRDIMEKTGAKNLVGIVMFGIKNGIVEF